MKHTHLRKCLIPTLAAVFLVCLLAFAVCRGTVSNFFPNNSADSGTDFDPALTLSEDEPFRTYIDALFCEEIAASPLSLHYTLKSPGDYGISSYSTDLGSYSAEDLSVSAALAESVIAALREYDADMLSVENRLTRDVLLDSLENTVAAASFPYYEEPLRPSTGVQSELPILLAEYTFESRQDVVDYLEILAGIPAYFDSICTYEVEKQNRGLFMSDFSAETVINQCEAFAASAEENYLIYTFEEKIESLTELTATDRAAFNRQNQTIVTEKVLPAFLQIADTLRELNNGNAFASSTAAGKDSYGLCELPMGSEYYAFLVMQATGSSDGITVLQNRVEEQRAADLLAIAALLEEYPSLETDSLSAAAPCETPEEMLELLKNAIRTDFPSVDNCSYTVKYVDAAMEDFLAPAFYLTAPLDDYTQNSIYINSGNGYTGIRLFTTLAHEGYPGHLYQNAFFCSTDPAPVRALLGPAGYSEGWATYVEMLSYHYAGLPDETAEFLALEQSVILSLYATADFGIHADGWSFAETLDFFSDYGFSDKETIREIFELIAGEPAHYLKYYIGYIEFLNLKKYAREIGGTDYSELAFHRAVLEMGPAPFTVLREYLPAYFLE